MSEIRKVIVDGEEFEVQKKIIEKLQKKVNQKKNKKKL